MKRPLPLLLVIAASAVAALHLAGCSAGVDDAFGAGNAGGAGGANGTGADGTGANAGSTGVFAGGNGAGGDGEGGMIVNPCGTECGPMEICDGQGKGLDDDCDGDVDEDCACKDGQASSCFKGDPSYLNDPGCNPGTMLCTEQGLWGPCDGGNHATEMCFNADPLGCHPINSVPFQTVDLSTGAGNFDDDATTHLYEVSCPSGVNPCPVPNGTDYTALQSGEYTVTYTKTSPSGTDECTFPLYVGARGLRVELSWNFQSSSTIDLDLHMHKPMDTLPWATGGADQDCGFANCKGSSFGTLPHWFPDANMVPEPVNWFLDPVFEANGCYFAPDGEGAQWQGQGMGCHNPRLDVDNISCDPSQSNPMGFDFCNPENINVDYPPTDEWTRIGVHYYQGTSTFTGQVTPTIKIFCDGALAAELGPQGFNDPPAPFILNGPADENKIWLVADVLFRETECVKECIVEPVYNAQGVNVPVVLDAAQWAASVGPPYPPVPPP